MNLVEIRSHDAPKQQPVEQQKINKIEEKESEALSLCNLTADEAKGFALTVKEGFVESILQICEQVRPKSFLQAPADERPFVCQGDPEQLLLIADESALITALDPKQILSWLDFEYALCLVIENRILRLYQANLEKQYQQNWNELQLLNDDDDFLKEVDEKTTAVSGDKKKKKRRRLNKRKKK